MVKGLQKVGNIYYFQKRLPAKFNADDYLDDHQDGNHEELGLQGLVVEEAHA